MSQVPHVNAPAPKQPKIGAPAQNLDGSNALPSTTTDRGAESASDHQSGSSVSAEKQKGASATLDAHPQSDDQSAAAAMPDAAPKEAGDI